jgi:hypothetical protein
LTVKTRNSTYDPSSICTSAHKNDGSIDRLPRRERHSAQSDFNTGITGSEDKTKIDVAVKMLREQGHTVHAQMRGNAFWFEIDGKMLASWEEIEDLADGVYSLVELEDRETADG